MTLKRALAAGSIALTGVGLLVPAVDYLLGGVTDPLEIVLGGLGVVIALALATAGGYVYVSDIRTDHATRVAAWNALGIVVLGTVLVVAGLSATVNLPTVVAVDVMGVSAVAHVLIGVNDVRRIRAREVAEQRRRLAVLNRLTRHNLRNDAQVLTALGEHLTERLAGTDDEETARKVRSMAEHLSEMNERLRELQNAIERDYDGETQRLAPLVENVVEQARERYPDATITSEVTADVAVRADGHLATALDHLLENAVEHGAGTVTVTVEDGDGWASLSVHDEGEGIPETEVSVLTEGGDITQLEHASGLGLWVVKTHVESYGGDLVFENPDATGETTVTLRLRTTAASAGR